MNRLLLRVTFVLALTYGVFATFTGIAFILWGILDAGWRVAGAGAFLMPTGIISGLCTSAWHQAGVRNPSATVPGYQTYRDMPTTTTSPYKEIESNDRDW